MHYIASNIPNGFIVLPYTSHFDLLSKDITMEGSGLYNSTELGSDNIPIEEKIVRAIVLSMVLLVGMVLNAIVILYTIYHPKSLKQNANIFLLGSAVANLAMLLSHIPVQVVTMFTEEWVFGSTDEERKVLCQINGFFTVSSGYAELYMLAIISVDRFFFLVKPLIHKRYFKPWLSCLLLLLVATIFCILSVLDVVFDRVEYFQPVNLCLPTRFVGLALAVCSVAAIAVLIIIIVVTTVWTFLSTHQFIRSDHQRRVDAIGSREEVAREMEDNLYTRRIKNVCGMFSLLLLSEAASIFPLGIGVLLYGVLDVEGLPSIYAFITSLFIYISCIINPIVQCYFRKDLNELFQNSLCQSKRHFGKYVECKNVKLITLSL